MHFVTPFMRREDIEYRQDVSTQKLAEASNYKHLKRYAEFIICIIMQLFDSTIEVIQTGPGAFPLRREYLPPRHR